MCVGVLVRWGCGSRAMALRFPRASVVVERKARSVRRRAARANSSPPRIAPPTRSLPPPIPSHAHGRGSAALAGCNSSKSTSPITSIPPPPPRLLVLPRALLMLLRGDEGGKQYALMLYSTPYTAICLPASWCGLVLLCSLQQVVNKRTCCDGPTCSCARLLAVTLETMMNNTLCRKRMAG